MQKNILSLLVIIGLSTNIVASSQMEPKIQKSTKHISHKKIRHMDTSHTKRKAVRRNFKTQKEFHHKTKRNVRQKRMSTKPHRNNRYKNGYTYQAESYAESYRNDYRSNRQRAYGNPNRGWLLAYRYDRASFYDNEGFYYGFFNRHGYYFEDTFYRYDRHYTFRDRVRGRGLFNHKYYMPANAQYYGFCSPRDHRRGHARAY